MSGSQTPLASSLVTTPPSNSANSSIVTGLSSLNMDSNRSVELAAAAAGVQLTDLPILNNQNQRSKLLQLLSEPNNLASSLNSVNNKNQLNRQSSQIQPNISQQQKPAGSPGNFMPNFSTVNNWPTNYKMNENPFMDQTQQLDVINQTRCDQTQKLIVVKLNN